MCLQVTPLTSLKFAELVVRAGFPPGVVNILPGSGILHTLIHFVCFVFFLLQIYLIGHLFLLNTG